MVTVTSKKAGFFPFFIGLILLVTLVDITRTLSITPSLEASPHHGTTVDQSLIDEIKKLTASDAAAEDWFGLATAMDGDTIVVRARIWLGQNIDTQVRLDGVDAPEIKGKCERERRLAVRARDLILARSAGGMVILSEIHYGKYAGRVVARVRPPGGGDFSTALVEAGLGRAYEGGRRESWCSSP